MDSNYLFAIVAVVINLSRTVAASDKFDIVAISTPSMLASIAKHPIQMDPIVTTAALVAVIKFRIAGISYWP